MQFDSIAIIEIVKSCSESLWMLKKQGFDRENKWCSEGLGVRLKSDQSFFVADISMYPMSETSNYIQIPRLLFRLRY